MPEPEGRMAASEGTEKLRAIKKKTLKYQRFHLQVREKQHFCDHVGLLETNSEPELAGVLM